MAFVAAELSGGEPERKRKYAAEKLKSVQS